jgi:outer membrane protein assembly factor BamB
MPISFLRSGRTLHKTWTYSAGSYIWRVLPTSEGLFIGEERDPAARKASFFCLDAANGKVLWHHIPLGDGWWTGFAAAAQGVLLLHGYASPDLPQHLKIFAVDVRTGTPLWSNGSVTFAGVHRNEVHAATPTGELVVLDLKNGNPLPAHASLPQKDEPDETLQFPAAVDLGEAVPGIKDLLDGEPFGPSELLVVAGYLVVAYCLRAEAGRNLVHAEPRGDRPPQTKGRIL